MAQSGKKLNVTLTNVQKIFFPKAGFTKGDLIKYYIDIADYILPHLKNRPVTLIRFPDGIKGERFYEKNAPGFTPTWVKTSHVPRRHETGNINYILINNVETLAWCANLAAIELHTFMHRAPHVERPDYAVFDLDPGEGTTLFTCARVALLIRDILEKLNLKSFPKVSGSKGLQLYIPLNTPVTYDATRMFAKAMAEYLEQQHPELVLSAMSKLQRRGKVFIDWSQNTPSKTTVSVYSLRGKRDEPYVSMPITWEEVKKSARKRVTKQLNFTPIRHRHMPVR